MTERGRSSSSSTSNRERELAILHAALPSTPLPFTLLTASGFAADRPMVMTSNDDTTWVCPPMNEKVRVTAVNSLGWNDERVLQIWSCRDDIAIIDSVTGEPVPTQADRAIDHEGKFSLFFGPVLIPTLGRRHFNIIVPYTTVNTDEFPAMPVWASNRSVEQASSEDHPKIMTWGQLRILHSPSTSRLSLDLRPCT